MRRHLDFLDSGDCTRRIEWRKCSIPESRTHCVPKFARKFFIKTALCAAANLFVKKIQMLMARVLVEKFACSFALFEMCKWLDCSGRGAITSEKNFESGQFSFGECSRHIQLPAIVGSPVCG
jgi:hypothetical protein